MAILKIARMGHPVLARRADPVADPSQPDIRRLVGDMLETLEDVGGIGLAAPQVHMSLRLVIFHVPQSRAGEGEEIPVRILVNPEITPLGGDIETDHESCLSIPGFTGRVPRWRNIRYRAVDLEGNELDYEAEGFHARVVQHECDHLDGLLYPMRMTDLSEFGFSEEILRRRQADG